MSQRRDLTSNTYQNPNLSNSLEFDLRSNNPFDHADLVDDDHGTNRIPNQLMESSNDDDRESAANSYSNSTANARGTEADQPNYGKPFNAYSGYYNQYSGTTSHLLSHENSSLDDNTNMASSQLLNSNSANKMQTPSEFDRYPSMAGSRVVSLTSLSSHFFGASKEATGAQSNSNTNGKSSDESLNNKSSLMAPFMGVDFSPFGDYPALSYPLHIDEKEPDDYLHNPDPIADAEYDRNRFLYDLKHMDRRSLWGLIGFIVLFLGALGVFVLFPVFTYTISEKYKPEVYEILTRYQYPILAAIRTDLVDPDTPQDARTKVVSTGDTWNLVFSDEFNAVGRTFYDGDDQFWTAPDIHYAATRDLEWYDPDASLTANGTLNLRMDAYKNHDLYYRSGMVQSWNKLCFTQGLLEFSAQLPNYGNITGLWPGLWSMGNLGRPGYLATTEGVWPYTYESCDVGITANQSSIDGISYLPGQRLNSCTCNGQVHPNPGVGRGAPEIDVLEAEMDTNIKVGVASQSFQVAPYDIWYMPDYNFVAIHNASITTMNTYAGGPFQQAVSAVTTLNTTWYEFGPGARHFQNFAYEYKNSDEDGYITWYVGNNPTMTLHSYALSPNGNIGWRRISKEPMSMIMNLGISNNWAYIDWPSIHFPVTFRIDYVRIYQPADEINLTCDPPGHPTYDYIQQHADIYTDANITMFTDKYPRPKNTLVDGCSL
ncbi:beta-glucan synthesis-associated protein [Scheffersomyces spartinae]|uniref:Beta-glucan synthesis-associated protein n=1 Tax=Scheffersomyces spartinae TaxID=45513 RepID=A0A9P8AI93_9ASCO|nr:beta-glucan synthesis-associated protein [Scheffersomyces spartinae]KAG7193500.1 beta-glucan synthesis-associated protein [Scheffersomyces spartinae]